MKSLPRFTFALVACAIVGYGISAASLSGFQAELPKGAGPRKPTDAASSPGEKAKFQQTSPDAPGQESPEAKLALDQARQRLLSYQSIQAKLVETVSMGNRRFTATGGYLQGRGADFKLRLEFQVKVGATDGAILEVCDGQVLWTRHQIGTETRISRRDVRQISQAAAESGTPDDFVTVELGFGGLPGLLASIERSMQFDHFKEDKQDNRKLVVIEGGWKPELLKLWKNNNLKNALPDHVPSRIRIYLESESLFPRRILYLNRNAEGLLRPMVSLDFSEVETNVRIPAEKFKFAPPDGVFPEDLTQQFLEQIKQRRQSRRSTE